MGGGAHHCTAERALPSFLTGLEPKKLGGARGGVQEEGLHLHLAAMIRVLKLLQVSVRLSFSLCSCWTRFEGRVSAACEQMLHANGVWLTYGCALPLHLWSLIHEPFFYQQSTPPSGVCIEQMSGCSEEWKVMRGNITPANVYRHSHFTLTLPEKEGQQQQQKNKNYKQCRYCFLWDLAACHGGMLCPLLESSCSLCQQVSSAPLCRVSVWLAHTWFHPACVFSDEGNYIISLWGIVFFWSLPTVSPTLSPFSSSLLHLCTASLPRPMTAWAGYSSVRA